MRSRENPSVRSVVVVLLAVAFVLASPSLRMARGPIAWAAGDPPMPAPTRSPAPGARPTAAELVNQGQELSRRREWQLAEGSFRAAAEVRPDLPEAWNGLGHALKNQWRFDESVAAYERALALRPRYPQALEYLGEAYVLRGDTKRAREILARLEPLDAQRARQLESVIDGKSAVASGW